MAKGFTKKQLENLINEHYDGVFSVNKLPVEVYEATVDVLTDAISKGFGQFDPDDLVKADLFQNFEHNIGAFSAAKTFQQTVDIQKALFSNGFKKPFSEFKKEAEAIFEQYNKNWLKTEYRTAYNNAIGARQWLDLQTDKDIAPLLRYDTANDERVRKEHEELDGIVRHIDDPFWRSWFPPNGWNCRCDVTSYFEDEGLELTPNSVIESLGKPPKLFDLNPAIDKVIFDPDSHPYFLVADRYKIQASNNFGLPVKPKPKPIEQKVEPGKLLQRLPFNDHLKNVKAKIGGLLDEHEGRLKPIKDEISLIEIELSKERENAAEYYLAWTKGDESKRPLFERSRELRDGLRDRKEKLIQKMKDFEPMFIDKVIDVLAQDEPLDINIKLSSTIRAAKGGFIEKGVLAFRRIVGKKDIINLPPEIAYSSRSRRASFTQRNNKAGYFGKVQLGFLSEIETVCHELGHWLEVSNVNIIQKNKEFFTRRTSGLTPRPLRYLLKNPGYSLTEIAIEDDFFNAYSGKIYPNGHYETLTMWFTHVLGGPEELSNFLKKDPDHFEFYLRLFYENK